MINIIWGLFIVIGIIYGLFNNNINITDVMIKSADSSIELIFSMLSIMCLWLGLMNICSGSGLLDIVAKKISPLLRVLFPDIPKNHISLSYISTNIVMNILGLSNAATPFGIKAMKSMQELNDNKEVASSSMITFLIINTSSLTLIPTSVISLRSLYGSVNPTDIVFASIITTSLSCLIGLIIDRGIYYIRRNR